MAAKRKNARVPKPPYGKWIRAKAVKFNRSGTVQVKALSNPTKRRKRRNVAAGFYDEDGYFHPIRASYDYSRSRAGEGTRKATTKKKTRTKR